MPRRTGPLPEARLELAPLIDVVFVLLAFFILALVVSTRLELTEILLPDARAAERDPSASGAPVVVSLTSEGVVRVGDQEVDLEDVAAALTTALGGSESAQVVIATDRDAPTGRFLELLDALASGGYSDLPILRQPSQGAMPAP